MIDIDNPEDLAAKGLKRIQIEGEEEEYLMDQEGNIYDLRGNFIGTTDDDGNNGLGGDGGMVSSQVGADQQQLIDDEDVDFGEYWVRTHILNELYFTSDKFINWVL